LDPGARRFQAPVPVDLNVGEATATWPALAMARGGAAYIAYLVTRQAGGGVPPGYVSGELRVARYSGALWSGFGAPLNRNPATPVRAPSAVNRPRVGVDLAGNGVVGWQEPDDALIDRVWARRLFGSVPGIPQQVSPGELGGRPARGPADAFSLDVAGFGQAAVSWRQQGETPGAPARLFTATLPETTVEKAAAFGAPRLSDGGGAAGPSGGAAGAPAVAVAAGGAFTSAFGLGASTFTVDGDDTSLEAPQRIDEGGSTVAGDPQVDVARSGAAVVAARLGSGGRGGLALAERRSDGVVEQRVISGAAGGAVGAFDLAGSGIGDALTGVEQGTGAGAQIVVSGIDAPPEAFAVQTPIGWVRRKKVPLRWDRPEHAIGSVRYAVTLDDDTVAENLKGDRFTLPKKALSNGVAVVQVVAEDDGGQETTSFPGELQVDGRAPRVRLSQRGRTLTVRLTDGTHKRRVSGVDASTVRISWGDGSKPGRGKKKLARTFTRGGRFRVLVTARDKAGNRARVARTVVVP
ncbi:MAG TPA: hypothetical protein VK631_18610, partial [Solirubrobacteraceae bacterium]|nr:hypothetical protein [Solirubrobacteraceae bacterium]